MYNIIVSLLALIGLWQVAKELSGALKKRFAKDRPKLGATRIVLVEGRGHLAEIYEKSGWCCVNKAGDTSADRKHAFTFGADYFQTSAEYALVSLEKHALHLNPKISTVWTSQATA
jgi:hypothetical protein